jgi:hypothetical protein
LFIDVEKTIESMPTNTFYACIVFATYVIKQSTTCEAPMMLWNVPRGCVGNALRPGLQQLVEIAYAHINAPGNSMDLMRLLFSKINDGAGPMWQLIRVLFRSALYLAVTMVTRFPEIERTL